MLGLSDVVLRIIGRGFRDGLGLSVTANAVACRVALAPRSAKATFDAILGEKLNFIVTNKSGIDRSSRIQIPLVQLILFAVSLAALLSASSLNPLVVAALLIFLLPLPAAILTANSLNSYRESISPSYKEAML